MCACARDRLVTAAARARREVRRDVCAALPRAAGRDAIGAPMTFSKGISATEKSRWGRERRISFISLLASLPRLGHRRHQMEAARFLPLPLILVPPVASRRRRASCAHGCGVTPPPPHTLPCAPGGRGAEGVGGWRESSSVWKQIEASRRAAAGAASWRLAGGQIGSLANFECRR